MRKYLRIILVSLFLISFISVDVSMGELKKPIFEKGDYWEYEITLYNYYENGTQYIEGIGILKTEVVKKDRVEIDGNTYDVIILNETLTTNYIDGQQVISIITRYLDENSLALLKEIQKVSGTWQVTEAVYSPPILYYNYPLTVGKNWSINSTVTFYPNGNATQYIALCECIGKQNITTKAGKFEDCYIVRRIEPSYISNDTYLSYYFAIHPDAYLCFFEEYLTNQTGENLLISYANLTSYSYNPEKKSEKTPGFEIAIAVSSLLMIHLLSRKRK